METWMSVLKPLVSSTGESILPHTFCMNRALQVLHLSRPSYYISHNAPLPHALFVIFNQLVTSNVQSDSWGQMLAARPKLLLLKIQIRPIFIFANLTSLILDQWSAYLVFWHYKTFSNIRANFVDLNLKALELAFRLQNPSSYAFALLL